MKALVTGANRGIGLALCSELHKKKFEVFALCRSSSSELESIGVQVFTKVDVTKIESLEEVKKKLATNKIDLLINNAGILEEDFLDKMDFDSIEQQFQVNCLGALKTTYTFLPLLTKGAKIAMITSRMGSIGDNATGGYYGYRISKAALNMLSVTLARDLKSKQISVGAFHPGRVSTRMIDFKGDLPPQEAAHKLLQRFEELTLENSGSFWHSSGERLPW